MEYETFKSEVENMISNLNAVSVNPTAGWAMQYCDIPIDVCECAAEIGGFDATFSKMFNKEFREDSVKMMLSRALSAVHG